MFYSFQIVLIIIGTSSSHYETCHLIASMTLLVYFVISTYFMIAQSFCYHYSVLSFDQYISISHLLLFFQVFTAKVGSMNPWYFTANVSVFSLATALLAIGVAYIRAKRAASDPYRQHIKLLASLAVDLLGVALSFGSVQSAIGQGSVVATALLASLAACLAATSAGLARFKLRAAR